MSIRTDKNPTASALFGIAVVQIALAGLDWLNHGAQLSGFGWIDWLVVFTGPIYIGLGIAARRFRLLAAIIGIVLYVAFCVEISELPCCFTLPVVILLLVALVSAVKHRAAETSV